MGNNLTGYPSIDKPWLKYYNEEIYSMDVPHCTMYEYIWNKNKSNLNETALVYFGQKIKYADLFKSIDEAASAFVATGIHKGDRVTVLSMHTPETIYCLYGLNKIGAVANFVYLSLPANDILMQTEIARSKALIYLNSAEERIRVIKDKLSCSTLVALSVKDSMPSPMKLLVNDSVETIGMRYKDFVLSGKGYETEPVSYEENAEAIIVYTSGTTGMPKGVVHTNDSINAVAFHHENSGLPILKGDTFMNVIPPFFGFGISVGIHNTLASGLTMILHIDPNAEAVAKALMYNKPSIMIIGPAFVPEIIKKAKGNMKWLKLLCGGGGAISEDQENTLNSVLNQHGSNTYYHTGYGMTEFGSTISINMDRCRRFQSLGVPFSHVNVKVVDYDTGNELTYGETGELWFSTPSMMKEYLESPEETAKTISVVDGVRWLHTGDLGHVDEDGFVYFDGRIKRIYLTRSEDGTTYKLFPDRIENIAKSDKMISQAACVVIEDKNRINCSELYIEGIGSIEESQLELIKRLINAQLPNYMLPKRIIVVNQIPTTVNGKIDYERVRQESALLISEF